MRLVAIFSVAFLVPAVGLADGEPNQLGERTFPDGKMPPIGQPIGEQKEKKEERSTRFHAHPYFIPHGAAESPRATPRYVPPRYVPPASSTSSARLVSKAPIRSAGKGLAALGAAGAAAAGAAGAAAMRRKNNTSPSPSQTPAPNFDDLVDPYAEKPQRRDDSGGWV